MEILSSSDIPSDYVFDFGVEVGVWLEKKGRERDFLSNILGPWWEWEILQEWNRTPSTECPSKKLVYHSWRVAEGNPLHLMRSLVWRSWPSCFHTFSSNESQMNQNTTTLKVQFTAQWPKPFSNGNGARIYPVARMDNWENGQFHYKTFLFLSTFSLFSSFTFVTKHNDFFFILWHFISVPKGDVLSEGEQAMVGVFAGLYGICFLVTLFLALSVLRFAPSLTNIILFFFILLTFLFRCIYLSIYASGGFRVEGSGSYVLVEPPSFFILSVASILIMSYGFCVYCLKKSVPQESAFTKFWTSWILFTIFLYCVLAVVLALLSTLNASDTIVSGCYGRIVTTESNFTVQAIRIAYHSFLLFLAIISAIVLFLLGRELKMTLKADSLSHLSIISGLSVLLTSILWVVYSALSGSSPYFVIPLWFCEAPPLLLVGFLVRPEKSDAYSESTYDRSRSWQSK